MSEDRENDLPSYVYALGRIEARPSSLSVERELAQARRGIDTSGKSDQQIFHDVLTLPENRYLARLMCWVFSVHGLDTYILRPRYSEDFGALVETIRPAPDLNDIDIVVGLLGPVAPPGMCGGLVLPTVPFTRVYSTRRDDLIKSIPKPDGISEKNFEPAVTEVFDSIMQLTDNAGATDEYRALNYLAVRYPAIYATAAQQFGKDFSFTGVEMRPSPIGRPRKIVEPIFVYQPRGEFGFTEKFFCRVDVSEEFPFLVTKLTPYYDR